MPIKRLCLSLSVCLLSLNACASPPPPCDCDVAVTMLRSYTQEYHACLVDVGNLRQQLKACQERR